jgi:hypothetical protein
MEEGAICRGGDHIMGHGNVAAPRPRPLHINCQTRCGRIVELSMRRWPRQGVEATKRRSVEGWELYSQCCSSLATIAAHNIMPWHTSPLALPVSLSLLSTLHSPRQSCSTPTPSVPLFSHVPLRREMRVQTPLPLKRVNVLFLFRYLGIRPWWVHATFDSGNSSAYCLASKFQHPHTLHPSRSSSI